MKEIEAAGGVVLRTVEKQKEVLLIYRNDIWDLPKGKREKGEQIEECAIREVAEETGINQLSLSNFIGETNHTYVMQGAKIAKKTYWYKMKLSGDYNLEPQKEEGITRVMWFEMDEAISKVGFENLKIILRKVKKYNSQQ